MAYNFREHTPEVESKKHEQQEQEEHFQPIGTEESGYATPDQGPFMCGNCVHYKPVNGTHGTCDHPEVIEDAEAGDIPKGREDGMAAATVAYEGCCDFFRPGEHE